MFKALPCTLRLASAPKNCVSTLEHCGTAAACRPSSRAAHAALDAPAASVGSIVALRRVSVPPPGIVQPKLSFSVPGKGKSKGKSKGMVPAGVQHTFSPCCTVHHCSGALGGIAPVRPAQQFVVTSAGFGAETSGCPGRALPSKLPLGAASGVAFD